MPQETVALILGYMFGFYMAWSIGANDVANAMATSVGAKAITIRQALWLAAILTFIGAAFIGSHVARTISRDIVSAEILADPHLALIGSLSALLASALWVSFATWKSLPVSTTHAVVGAMIGYGIMAGGFACVNWAKLGAIALSWIISPMFSFVIAFLIFKLIVSVILSKKNAFARSLEWSPVFIGLTGFIIVLSFLFKTPLGTSLAISTPAALGIASVLAAILGVLGKTVLKRFTRDKAVGPEEVFRGIQVGTACYVALALGANDVANAIGPLAVIHFLVKTGGVGAKVSVPVFLLIFGGIGIAAGIATAGHRVMETLGERITTLSNTRGFSAEFAAATTVLLASKMGLPVSTTHAAVGGVLGVGLARGIEAVNFGIIFRIILYWILTVPAAAVTCMILFKTLQLLF